MRIMSSREKQIQNEKKKKKKGQEEKKEAIFKYAIFSSSYAYLHVLWAMFFIQSFRFKSRKQQIIILSY